MLQVEAEIASTLGRTESVFDSRVVRAIAACRTGTPPELVARHLHWSEFESFGADLLKASGYGVEQDVVLKNPRAQIDILGRSGRIAVAVDCKRWSKSAAPGVAMKVARAQGERAVLLRSARPYLEPIVAVILMISLEAPLLMEGAAVVPIHAFRDFLESLDSLVPELTAY